MIKKTLLTLVLSYLIIAAYSQSCLPDGIIFTSQSQIDNFPTNYPGCSVILGDLIIENMDDIDVTNVDSLIYLTEILGDLSITIQYGSPFLSSLEGLSSINNVGGDLKIGACYDLYTLEGLDNINSIGGQLFIAGNPYLSNLTGLNNLNSVGSITIQNNNNLTSLTGIDSIDYTTLSSLTINYNDELTWCSIYSVCNYINSEDPNITISYNNTGCGNQAQVEEMCITGINSKINDFDIVVYPNPVNDILNISIDYNLSGSYIVNLYSLTGKKINSNSNSNSNKSISLDVAHLSKGMYYIILKFENKEQIIKKIVKL